VALTHGDTSGHGRGDHHEKNSCRRHLVHRDLHDVLLPIDRTPNHKLDDVEYPDVARRQTTTCGS